MRLHLSVAYRAGSPPWPTDGHVGTVHEVEVEVPEGSSASELARALVSSEGLAADPVLAVGGTLVHDEAVVGLPPLVDGTALVLTTADDPRLTAPDGLSRPRPRTPVTVAVTHGPDAGHVRELPAGRHLVGRSPAADLCLDDDGLSRLHVEVEVRPDGVTVRDLGSTNGSVLDDLELGGTATPFTVGSTLRLGATVLTLGPRSTVPAATVRAADGTRTVNRRPRLRETPVPSGIALPTPPSPPRRTRVPWVAVLLPVPVAAVMAVFLGPTMLAFALMGPVVMVGTALGDRWGARRTYAAELRVHATLLQEAQARVDAACIAESRAARQAHPDPAALLTLTSAPGDRLWERSTTDTDLLTASVGRCTRAAATRVIRPPGDTGPEHPLLHDAPCTVPLDTVGVLGVAGDAASCRSVTRHLVGQLASLVSPHDLEIAVVTTDGEATERWSWLLRLPHLRTADGSRRPTSSGTRTPGSEDTARSCLAALADTVRTRHAHEAAAAGPARSWTGPRVLLVVDGIAQLRGLPELGTVLADGPAVGVVTVCLDRDRARLPSETRAVLTADQDSPTLDLAGHDHQDLVLDGVGPWWADRLSRSLAGLRDASPAGPAVSLPSSTGLLALCGLPPVPSLPSVPSPMTSSGAGWLDPSLLVARWQETPHRTDVPLGVVGGETLRVDLATDGPHVLVAGTTGAGKSELLRTLVATLALHHRPEHLSLVLVDYKGGAAFRECADLPHVAGVVTDLDGSLADRALRSLTAELTRRERLLGDAGASDFVDYQDSEVGRRAPLARLVVVIDEFRALAEELPAFVDGLVRIAALGRSLGVHLVLATQRPAGVVTADIKANVNLRIALRVRDRADSDDVIDAPDAAALDQSLPGRAFARVGGGSLVRFQAAHVGRAVEQLTPVGPLCRPVALGTAPVPWPDRDEDAPTELAAVVDAVRRAATLLGAVAPPPAWLPPLPDRLGHEELGAEDPGPQEIGHAGYTAPLGLVDRPDTQARERLDLDLRRPGHWAFVGSAGSGRTTALLAAARGLAARRGPTALHLYAVSGGSLSALSSLPHLGAHVEWTDTARLDRLVDRLTAEVAQRREALASHGLGSMQEWWAVDGAAVAPPPLVLLVDDWDLLVHHSDAAGPVLSLGTPVDRLLAVLREGDGVGLTALLSGDRSLLVGRGAAATTHRVVLRLADRGDAALAGVPDAATRASTPPGRAWLSDRCEVQLALPATTPPLRTTATVGHLPWRVDPLPVRVRAGAIARDGLPPDALAVGAGGDETRTLVLRPATDGRRWLVGGSRGSGVSTSLLHLAQELLRMNRQVAVVSPRPGPLDVLRDDDRVTWCGTDADALVRARRRTPGLAVVVDAGDELLDHPVEQVLREVLRLADRDEGLVVVGADATALSAMYRGIAVEVARHRTGIVLGPASATQSDVLGVRVPVERGARPGRGHLVVRGEATPVQVALPTVGATQAPGTTPG